MFRKSFLLLLFLLPLTSRAQVNHRAFIQQARFELSEERFTDALRSLNTAIGVRPDLFEPWFLRGVAKYNLGDFSGAESDFSEALRLHPLHIRSFHYRGLTRLRLANYYDALYDFRKALELDPYDAGLRLAMGDALLNMNKPAEATEEYRMALTIQPRLAEAWLKKGMAARMLGNTDQALSDMSMAVQYDFFSLDARMRLALLKTETGRKTEALEDFDALQRIHPDEPIVFFQRALVELDMGDTTGALRSLEKVNQLESGNTLALYNRALIYSQLKDYRQAISLFGQVLSQQPTHILSWFNRGVAQLKIDAFTAAEADFSRSITLFPGFVAAWVNRAEARQALGRRKEANEDRQTATRLLEEQYKPDVPDSPFRNDSLWFKKIMRLESEFAGPALASRPQFQQQEVRPYGLYVVNVAMRGKENGLHRDAFTASLDLNYGQQFVFGWVAPENLRVQDSIVANNQNPMPDSDIDLFKLALSDLKRSNYSKALSWFEMIGNSSALYISARINKAVVMFLMEELKSEAQLPLHVSISNSVSPAEPSASAYQPDYSTAINELKRPGKKMAETAFLYHNLGFMLLRSGQYHPAIDAFTDALALDPSLGESWYNRALVLLFLSENRLACSDLSKAGEQGIPQAYALIRRYCVRD